MAETGQTVLTLTVKEFQGDQVEQFEFEQQTKVSDAIEVIVEEFNAESINDPTLFHDGERLQDNRTLVSYHLDGETVILAASTAGV